MRFETAQLAAFLKKTATIKTNTILPILGSICFRDGFILKTNLQESIEAPLKAPVNFLVDEKTLAAFINSTNADFIDIDVKEKTTTITDGSATLKLPTESAKEYPKEARPDDDKWRELPPAFVWCLETAGRFIDPTHIQLGAHHARVHGSYIYASDAMCIIRLAAPDWLDGAVFPAEFCRVAARIEDDKIWYQETDNALYLMAANSGICYRFTKQETARIDLSGLIPKEQINWQEIDKQPLVQFNDTAIAISRQSYADCILQNDMEMTLQDSDYDRELNQHKPCGVNLQRFRYNAAKMNKILKAMPSDKISISTEKKGRAMFSMPGVFALLMALADI